VTRLPACEHFQFCWRRRESFCDFPAAGSFTRPAGLSKRAHTFVGQRHGISSHRSRARLLMFLRSGRVLVSRLGVAQLRQLFQWLVVLFLFYFGQSHRDGIHVRTFRFASFFRSVPFSVYLLRTRRFVRCRQRLSDRTIRCGRRSVCPGSFCNTSNASAFL